VPQTSQRLFDAMQPTANAVALLGDCRGQAPWVPAEHQDVQRDRMGPVERGGAAEDVVIGVALDAAVQELIAGCQLIEQAGPAPPHAEYHRIAPHHCQFPRRVAGGAFQPQLIDLEDNRTLSVHQHQVRSQRPRRFIETQPFDRRVRRYQVDGFGEMAHFRHGPVFAKRGTPRQRVR
jgi:hypothetical protein